MIKLKTDKEIETMARGGAILADILDRVAERVQPGVITKDLDEFAQELIKKQNAKPAFLGYATPGHKPFPAALCVSVNEGVVHGLPNERVLKEGDLVGLDCGLIYEGLYLDHARTIPVGYVSGKKTRLLNVTKEALRRGIEEARPGRTIGDIGSAIQSYVESRKFSIVHQLVGHGVGYNVHEEPQVPNYGDPGKGPVLEEGLVIAIEPMVTFGNPFVETADDGWTVVVASGQVSAHEEHTVAVTAGGPRILTMKEGGR